MGNFLPKWELSLFKTGYSSFHNILSSLYSYNSLSINIILSCVISSLIVCSYVFKFADVVHPVRHNSIQNINPYYIEKLMREAVDCYESIPMLSALLKSKIYELLWKRVDAYIKANFKGDKLYYYFRTLNICGKLI